MFRTFQVIRRETYIYLKELKAKLLGSTYSYDRKKDAFGGIEDNTVSLPNAALPAFGDAAMDVIDTTTMLKGEQVEERAGHPHAPIAADATLGRNACHFPPESWLRWRDYHLRATAADRRRGRPPGPRGEGQRGDRHQRLRRALPAGLLRRRPPDQQGLRHGGGDGARQRGDEEGAGHERRPRSARCRQATAHKEAYSIPRPAKNRRTRAQGRHRAAGLGARQPRGDDGT